MRPLDEKRREDLNGMIDELTEIKSKINSKQATINGIIVDLNDDIQKYNNVLHNMEAFAERMVTEFEDYHKEHNRDWDATDAGKAHVQAQNKWETLQLEPVELIDDIEVMDELVHVDDISRLPVQR